MACKRLHFGCPFEIIYLWTSRFRWAYCQCESLRTCVKLSALRRNLASLPKSLDETYARIIRHLESEGHLSDAITVLRWLCFAARPLRLSEVVEILAIESGENGGFNPEERLPDPEDVLAICGSFISCHQILVEDEDEEDESEESEGEINHIRGGDPLNAAGQHLEVEVRLAHFSVKEYLLSDRCHLRSEFTTNICHNLIAEGCLHYFLHATNETLPTEDIAREYPLVKYAADHWWQHAQNAGNARGPAMITLAQALLASELHLLAWLRCNKPILTWGNSLHMNRVGPPLYYASLVGLPELVSLLLEAKEDVNALGPYGSALYISSREGHLQTVQLLLEGGANVNLTGMFGSALSVASERGHLHIVQLLLKNGADVNFKGYTGTPLYLASQEGHLQIVQLLLENGANINVTGGYYGTALYVASQKDHLQIVQLLLNNGADTNLTGGPYGTALSVASEGGHLQMAHMLLANGADVNLTGAPWGSALQAAALSGNEQMVQLLLNHGAKRTNFFTNAQAYHNVNQ